MAVKINNFGKPIRNEKAKPAATAGVAGKEGHSSGIFQSLLNGLKGKGNTPATTSLQNRPASSRIISHDRTRVASPPRSGMSAKAQNVNNLAASTLIAMAAMSSGTNRMQGLYSRSPGIGVPPGAAMALPSVSQPSAGTAGAPGQAAGIGTLSAQFESGEKGPEVIGFDDKGGTSYGTYQISSQAGTMRRFVEYLSEKAPDLAAKLQAAGPANTGGRSGKMPDAWKKVAGSDPVRFANLQYDFIEKTHYLPAVQEVSERTGLDVSQGPRALQEVLWSTAVQHGPRGAAKIFSRAVERAQTGNGGIQLAKLIGSVYEMRAGQFGSSTAEVRSALRNRFREEGRIALAMLSNPFMKSDGLRA